MDPLNPDNKTSFSPEPDTTPTPEQSRPTNWQGSKVEESSASKKTHSNDAPIPETIKPLEKRGATSISPPLVKWPISLQPYADSLTATLNKPSVLPPRNYWNNPKNVEKYETALSKLDEQSLPIAVEGFCNLGMNAWYQGNYSKAVGYFDHAAALNPEQAADWFEYWELASAAQECRFRPASLEAQSELIARLEALSERNIPTASWALAMIHFGLVSGFDLISDPSLALKFQGKACEQFLKRYQTPTVNMPLMPPRVAFTSADCSLHIKPWDFSAIDALSDDFSPLETVCIMTQRDLSGFYAPAKASYAKVIEQHKPTLVHSHTAESIIAKLLFFVCIIPSKGPLSRYSATAPLSPDLMIQNLDRIISHPDLFDLDVRAKALTLKAQILEQGYSRKEKDKEAHTQVYAQAHAYSSAMIRAPKTIQELCTLRKYHQAADCLRSYVRSLRAHGEAQLADFYEGKIAHYEQLDEDLKAKELMSVEELTAQIVSLPKPQSTSKSSKKKKKKKTSTNNDTSRVITPPPLSQELTASSLVQESETLPETKPLSPPQKHPLTKWDESVYKNVAKAVYSRDYGLYQEAHTILDNAMAELAENNQTGAERLLEEKSWCFIHTLYDPAAFTRIPKRDEKQRQKIRDESLGLLNQAEECIRESLAIRLRMSSEQLPKNAAELITIVQSRSEQVVAKMTKREAAFYLFGLRCVLGTFGHIYSSKTIFLGIKKQKVTAAIARDFYAARDIDPEYQTMK